MDLLEIMSDISFKKYKVLLVAVLLSLFSSQHIAYSSTIDKIIAHCDGGYAMWMGVNAENQSQQKTSFTQTTLKLKKQDSKQIGYQGVMFAYNSSLSPCIENIELVSLIGGGYYMSREGKAFAPMNIDKQYTLIFTESSFYGEKKYLQFVGCSPDLENKMTVSQSSLLNEEVRNNYNNEYDFQCIDAEDEDARNSYEERRFNYGYNAKNALMPQDEVIKDSDNNGINVSSKLSAILNCFCCIKRGDNVED